MSKSRKFKVNDHFSKTHVLLYTTEVSGCDLAAVQYFGAFIIVFMKENILNV